MTTLIQIEKEKLSKMLKEYKFMSEGTVNLVTKSNNESFKEWLQQKNSNHLKNCACYICQFKNNLVKDLEK